MLGTVARDPALDDFPWQVGVFSPASGFAGVQELFVQELRLLDADRMDEWQEVWDLLAEPGLRLEPEAGGELLTEVLIHVSGSKAWWRS